MLGDADVSLPPIGQLGRLHVAGRSVPVEVFDHVRDSVTLEVVEDGWSLTDGDARLVVTGADGTGMIAGRHAGARRRAAAVHARRLDARRPGGRPGERRRGRRRLEDAGRPATAAAAQTPPPAGAARDFRVDVLLDVVVLSGGRELPAQTLNLSPTGCLLRGAVRPMVDTLVSVRIPLDDRQLQLRAQVTRVDGERYALHFREMDAAQERQLSGLLAKRQREILRRR